MSSIQKCSYTHAERTIIKKDWQPLLPDMAFKPKTNYIFFDRIVGPLAISVGIYLDARIGRKKYSVKFSVHNLARQRDSLGMQIKTIPSLEYIAILFEEHKSKYQDIAAALKQSAWIPIDGPITLDDIFNGYSNAAKDKVSHANKEYEKYLAGWTKAFGGDEKKARESLEFGSLTLHEAPTPALVAAWAGELEKAKEYLDWAYKVAGWEADKMLEIYGPLIEQPELLRATARAERIKHGLTYAPCQNIIGVPYQETWQD